MENINQQISPQNRREKCQCHSMTTVNSETQCFDSDGHEDTVDVSVTDNTENVEGIPEVQ